jgi:LysR family transcriptional activator of mexEF-oprN operon
LDLNLLRAFVVVAETRSVTEAAKRLYVTQPAVSAALRRLGVAVGAPLFARAGRGLVLTARGARLFAEAAPHLEALVRVALSPPEFDARESRGTVHLGLSDASEAWLLPPLLRALEGEAPHMRIVVLPVQFRTVAEALATGRVDLAVTVADDLPAGTHRETLFTGGFVCLYDPRHADVGPRLTRAKYLAHAHVVVSYNGDLRGVVEDQLGIQRRVRVSVPSFHAVGVIVEGSPLLATVPAIVAREIVGARPRLRTAPLPFDLGSAPAPLELLARSAVADDGAVAFVRSVILRLAKKEAAKRR